jgi:hypothetical protein
MRGLEWLEVSRGQAGRRTHLYQGAWKLTTSQGVLVRLNLRRATRSRSDLLAARTGVRTLTLLLSGLLLSVVSLGEVDAGRHSPQVDQVNQGLLEQPTPAALMTLRETKAGDM